MDFNEIILVRVFNKVLRELLFADDTIFFVLVDVECDLCCSSV